MGFSRNAFFLWLIIIFSSLVFLSSCGEADNTQSSMVSCLVDNRISNFTLFPTNHDDPNVVYYTFLNFSIQNLRFAESLVPKPIAIVLPETKEQLVKTVLCCRKGSWEIRVRCGGHSYEGTSYVATDGSPFVIIDLMNLNRVSVDVESEVAWVEGGATLGQTYYAISEASGFLGFSAGSCPTVGAGGHIAGGGFGLLSRKYGLAADNVVDALLVDANGQLLHREAMGEEVFWAIRGGGGGIWGIVYAWKIKLLKVPQVVTSFVLSRPGTKYQVAKLIHKWQHVAPKLSDDFYLSAFVGAGLPEATATTGISATFKGFFLGSRREALSLLNTAFPELSLVEEDCKEMSWIESILYFSGLGPQCSVSKLKDRYLDDKKFFKGKSDYVKAPISMAGIKSAVNILEREPKGYVILDPYGGFMEKVGSESIAFPHRKGNLFSIQYMVEWYEKDNGRSNEYIKWIREFYGWMAPHVSGSPRAAYINYMDLDLGVMNLIEMNTTDGMVEMARVWGEKYFLGNYDRLVRAKTLIDPLNIFRHQQGIPPMPTAAAQLHAPERL